MRTRYWILSLAMVFIVFCFGMLSIGHQNKKIEILNNRESLRLDSVTHEIMLNEISEINRLKNYYFDLWSEERCPLEIRWDTVMPPAHTMDLFDGPQEPFPIWKRWGISKKQYFHIMDQIQGAKGGEKRNLRTK